MPGIQLDFNDPFEGILYRTHVSESKLNISFISSVFFETFKNKIHADHMSSVDIDRTSFMSKCTTHIDGAKCDLKLEAHFKSVELSGIGYKKWRDLRFPRIVQFLFKRVMQEMDSIVEEPIKSEQGSVELTDLNSNDNQTTSGQCDVNANVRSSVTSRNWTARA